MAAKNDIHYFVSFFAVMHTETTQEKIVSLNEFTIYARCVAMQSACSLPGNVCSMYQQPAMTTPQTDTIVVFVTAPMKRSKLNPYWLFATVNRLEVGSSDMNDAWANQTETTRTWFAETARTFRANLRDGASHRMRVEIPVEMIYQHPREDHRLSKIRDQFDNDVARGLIDSSTSFIDYCNDIICNEPYN